MGYLYFKLANWKSNLHKFHINNNFKGNGLKISTECDVGLEEKKY